jgi:putative membrane protein
VSPIGRFDEDAQRRISDAVRGAESDVSAEIVTYIVGRCDGYAEADWAAAVAGGALGLAAGLMIPQVSGSWAAASPILLAYAVVLGAVGGWALVAVPAVRRLFVPNHVLDGRSSLRAEAAFLEEEVFATRDRVGILMFLALFERRCVVMADRGVLAVVPAEALEEPVRLACDGMGEGRPVEGVLAGIDACRRLLAVGGLAATPADVDELPDEPRVRDR